MENTQANFDELNLANEKSLNKQFSDGGMIYLTFSE